MITRAKISAVSANSFVVVEQFSVFPGYMEFLDNRRIGGAALIQRRRLLTFLSQMRRLFEGGTYLSKYGTTVLSIRAQLLRRLEIVFIFPRLVLQILFQIQFGLS